jgi:hypothetical protein
LFKLSETRGKESSGIAIKDVKEGQISIVKQSVRGSKFIKLNEYRDVIVRSFTSHPTEKDPHLIGDAPLALVAHARLVTNGTRESHHDNQPIVKDGIVMVHNGIIVNVDKLWEKYRFLNREYEVDSEILAALFRYFLCRGKSIREATAATFREIEGAASIAVLLTDYDQVLIATNTGSLYRVMNKTRDSCIFASERFILSSLLRKNRLEEEFDERDITWIRPRTACVVDLAPLLLTSFDFEATGGSSSENKAKPQVDSILDLSRSDGRGEVALHHQSQVVRHTDLVANDQRLLEYNSSKIDRLRRCTRCILPETFPFISFDLQGVCNYCRSYQKMSLKGMDALKRDIEFFKAKKDGSPDCIVAFSGGRDSSYGLHIAKEVLGLTPIAYTYDWGMVTDLGRRNQARLCGRAGIEHIVISADIDQKRENIRKNVSAWLERPHLGTIPLFMAGDKQYFYYANVLRKINKIQLVILCENMLETTYFKSGFCGIRPNFGVPHTYTLSFLQKAKLASFYAKEFFLNPSYLNSSLVDTVEAFLSYYAIPHQYLNIYDYIQWSEAEIQSTLSAHYDWEESTDTATTWRIGDGTAAFYNYIYYTVAGFSENDTFRSNQIREGLITREEALKAVNRENQPRYESVKWYLDAIGLDFESTVTKINSIPKLYLSLH